MTTSPATRSSRRGSNVRVGSAHRDDLLAAMFAAWLVLGMFLDGRAHREGLISADSESFFSVWHFILYTGFIATATWVVRLAGGMRTVTDRSAVRPGYGLAALGVPLFLLSGLADMVWHLAWGFEDGLESAMSPPHLMLIVGGLLLITGPVRAAWRQGPWRPSVREFLPAALALGLAVAVVVSWSSSLLRPLPWAVRTSDVQLREYFDLILYQKVLVADVLLLCAMFLTVKRWRPPAGTFTLIYGLVGVLNGIEDDFHVVGSIVALLVAGVLVDVAAQRWYPDPATTAAFARLGFVVGAITWSCYIASIAVFHGLVWSHQMWSGIVCIAALTGSLLGVVVGPGRGPVDATPAPDRAQTAGDAAGR